jgi:hypothetical protein
VPRRRTRRKGVAIFTACVLAMLAVAGYFAYSAFQHVTPFLTPAGCQAGSGTSAVALDPQQASIAATIAGVASRDRLPARAVTIAYATAMQESHMHNLDYGDLDSVGVFQQRPSEGWGTASQLEDPVYATTKFFGALNQIPGYLQMPVDEAAQAVQHSADGSAYAQYDRMATSMTSAFTGQWPRAVWCWAGPGQSPPPPNLAASGPALAAAFGPGGAERPIIAITLARSAKSVSVDVRVQSADAWTVASWLVTHAPLYGISDVRYAGYRWTASAGSRGWQPASGTGSRADATSATSGSILLH